MNTDLITINKIEIASELAAERTYEYFMEVLKKIPYKLDNEDTIYTDEAQDYFNELYDHYLSLLEQFSIKT